MSFLSHSASSCIRQNVDLKCEIILKWSYYLPERICLFSNVTTEVQYLIIRDKELFLKYNKVYLFILFIFILLIKVNFFDK